jgi:hypothetical protein
MPSEHEVLVFKEVNLCFSFSLIDYFSFGTDAFRLLPCTPTVLFTYAIQVIQVLQVMQTSMQIIRNVVATPAAMHPTNWERENKKKKGCQISILIGYYFLGNESPWTYATKVPSGMATVAIC